LGDKNKNKKKRPEGSNESLLHGGKDFNSDVLGSYTGQSKHGGKPTQDADDL